MTDNSAHANSGEEAADGPGLPPPVHPGHPGPEQPYAPQQQPVYEQPAPQQPGYEAPQQPGYGPPPQPQQPGHAPPGGQAAPGQPYGPVPPEQPAAPKRPSSFTAFLLTPLTVLQRIWSGDTGSALAYPGEVGQKFGKAHGPWLTVGGTIVVLAMISGLFGALVSDISMRVNSPFGVPAMTYVVSVLLLPLLVGASYVLRVLTIRWTLGARQVANASLAEAGNIMAAAGSLHVAFWAVLVPLSLLPGTVGGMVFGLGGAAAGFVAILAAELIIYVGISHRVEAQKSPLVPHVLLSLAHAAMLFLLVAIFLSASLEATIYSGSPVLPGF